MDRESFIAGGKERKFTDVALPDGRTMKARKLTQGEVETMRKRFSSEDKALDGLRYIVVRCAVKENGERMFSDDDMTMLADCDFDVINAIANEVMRFSGLNLPKNQSTD